MSRWIENFENHAFQELWKEAIDAINALEVNEDTTDTGVLEIARLKKVAILINNFLEACDPEIIPSSVWDSFLSDSQKCIAELNNYKKISNGTYITNTNTYIEQLLTLISPYLTLSKVTAKTVNAAFKEHSKTIEESLSVFQQKARKTSDEIESLKLSSEENTSKCEEAVIAIEQFKEKLLDDSEVESTSTLISNFATQIEEIHDELLLLYKKIFEGDSTEDSIESEISSALKKSIEESKEIEALLEAITQETKSYKAYHQEVFGVQNDEGELEGGLKQEIEIRRKSLDSFKKQQEEKYDALNEEIESLLPGATSAGLASAFKDLKMSCSDPIRKHSRNFYWSIAILLAVSLISITQKVGFWVIEFVDITSPISMLSNLAYKLPIILPVLWFAAFSAKRRSEAARLEQEYAHKEALAKSYQSFKTQIEALGSGDPALMEKLLSSAIDAIAFNASATLDNKHSDSPPANELLEKFTEFVVEANIKKPSG